MNQPPPSLLIVFKDDGSPNFFFYAENDMESERLQLWFKEIFGGRPAGPLPQASSLRARPASRRGGECERIDRTD